LQCALLWFTTGLLPQIIHFPAEIFDFSVMCVNFHSLTNTSPVKVLLSICLLSISVSAFAQHEWILTVHAGNYNRSNCPVVVDLSSTGIEVNNNEWQLLVREGKNESPVAFQFAQGRSLQLLFILGGELKRGEKRDYVLRQSAGQRAETRPGIVLVSQPSGLIVSYQDKPLLNYQFNEVYPPAGIDPIFRRSGFIHPIWSPGGEVLSRIQAPDHYHHYGLWGPWTKTHIKGREVDFWNLAKGEGTVRFAKFLTQYEGQVTGGFTALQEHVDFGAKGGDKVAINEVLDVRAWTADLTGRRWLIDYTSVMNCPLDSGIMLDAYRYGGGIGFRATESWTKDNSAVLTSESKDRLSADGTKARWCIIEGASKSGRSGILFMGHPSNREYPEPMRVWPVDANAGRGDVYFEFCPIRHKEWKLENGQDYSQKYRLLVFDGTLSQSEAEQYWQAFAFPPNVTVKH
jgi:hypothetical protein